MNQFLFTFSTFSTFSTFLFCYFHKKKLVRGKLLEDTKAHFLAVLLDELDIQDDLQIAELVWLQMGLNVCPNHKVASWFYLVCLEDGIVGHLDNVETLLHVVLT